MKKKILSLTLTVCIVLSLFSGMTFTVGADTEGYYTYTVTDGKATITDVDENISGDKTIPSTLGGYPVTSIGDWAFLDCAGLTSITIPNSVTSIGNYAFLRCTGLTSITIPNSVTAIGWCAFSGCTGVESITVQTGNVKYHSSGNCVIESESKALILGCRKSIIPSDGSVTSIGDGAFEGCTGLTSITIPDSVTSIGSGAFYGCTGLTSITIPNSVTSIGDLAFCDCTGLTDVYYAGTEQEKAKIDFGEYNDELLNATWHYNSTGHQNEPTPQKNFPDVSYTAWYGDSVAYAVGSGLMTGYASGKFGTTDGIQRQDFVIILARLSGADLNAYKGQKAFKDVDPNAYYAPALAWAKANGVSSGYNDGSFGVGRKVTREQIMTFLHNYAVLQGYNITVTDAEKAQIRAQYSDFKNVSGYAQEATYWALKNGVISGKEVNGKRYISPSANAQRCEVAAMFYNINQNNIFA